MANKKSLRRNLSLVTVSLCGHLFDTKCFNNVIDLCEENQVQFKVIGWDIGNFSNTTSSVTIQMMTSDTEALNTVMDKIEETAEKLNINITTGTEQEVDGSFNFSQQATWVKNV